MKSFSTQLFDRLLNNQVSKDPRRGEYSVDTCIFHDIHPASVVWPVPEEEKGNPL